ncbi:MAG: hypothetical protein ACLFSQ_12500 [Candidatus Zixiibacteriota bacterium]
MCPNSIASCSCGGVQQYLPNPDNYKTFALYCAALSQMPGYYQTLNGIMYFHADIIGKTAGGDPIYEPDNQGQYTM